MNKLSPVDKAAKVIVEELLNSKPPEEGLKIAAQLLGRTVAVDRKGDQFKADVAELRSHKKVIAKAEKRVADSVNL